MSAKTLNAADGLGAARRLSSIETSVEELDVGPIVVVPPKHLMASSEGQEIAESMALARAEVEMLRSSVSTPDSALETTVTDKYAFAFDIDGVLIRGGKVIPQAIAAMKVLNGQNDYGIKV